MNKLPMIHMLFFLLSADIGYASIRDTNGIVFWEPSEQITLNQLTIDLSNNVSFQTLQTRYKITAILPLEAIDTFYWDEQIFILKDSKKISHVIHNIARAARTDNALIPLFSIIIDNKLIASGINRLSLLSSAQGKPYDNIRHSCFFIGTYVYRKNKIYFRFTPSLKVEPDLSIYESESDEDIAHIIKEELYHWLHEKTSIVHGYFDIYEMMRTGKIISVKEHKKMEDCEIRYYGSYSEPIVP